MESIVVSPALNDLVIIIPSNFPLPLLSLLIVAILNSLPTVSVLVGNTNRLNARNAVSTTYNHGIMLQIQGKLATLSDGATRARGMQKKFIYTRFFYLVKASYNFSLQEKSQSSSL